MIKFETCYVVVPCALLFFAIGDPRDKFPYRILLKNGQTRKSSHILSFQQVAYDVSEKAEVFIFCIQVFLSLIVFYLTSSSFTPQKKKDQKVS